MRDRSARWLVLGVGWLTLAIAGCQSSRVCDDPGPAGACDPELTEVEVLATTPTDLWQPVELAVAGDTAVIRIAVRAYLWNGATGAIESVEDAGVPGDPCTLIAVARCGDMLCGHMWCDQGTPTSYPPYSIVSLTPGEAPTVLFEIPFTVSGMAFDGNIGLADGIDGALQDIVVLLDVGTPSYQIIPGAPSVSFLGDARAGFAADRIYYPRFEGDVGQIVSFDRATNADFRVTDVVMGEGARVDRGPVLVGDQAYIEVWDGEDHRLLRFPLSDPSALEPITRRGLFIHSLVGDDAGLFFLGTSVDLDQSFGFGGIVRVDGDELTPFVGSNDWGLSMFGGADLDDTYVYAVFSEACDSTECPTGDRYRYHLVRARR